MRDRYAQPARALARRTSWARRAAALATMGMVACVASAAAQTVFARPDTVVDVGTYATAEECAAAVARAREAPQNHASHEEWTDTLPFGPKEPLEPLPRPVVETARRCTARFPAATVPLGDFSLILPLYLVANRDADVSVLVRRRLAAIGSHGRGERSGSPAPSAEEQRAATLDTLFDEYLIAQPVRLAAAESLAAAVDRSLPRPLHAASALQVLTMYGMLQGKAMLTDDSARARSYAVHALALYDSLAPSEQATVKQRIGGDAAFGMWMFATNIARTGTGTMLDSLRRGTAAYLALLQSLWTTATGSVSPPAGFPLGRHAPPLTGAVFPDGGGAAGPRPVPGKVNLVVFLHGQCTDVQLLAGYRLHTETDCRQQAAVLRRMAARFPELAITVVDRTHGAFMYLPPPTADAERALVARAIRAHCFPGTVVVATTDFSRLSPPDRRRREKPYLPDFTPYYFSGTIWEANGGAMFIIDRDGTVVMFSGSGVDRQFEQLHDDVIGILLSRQEAASGAARPAAPGPHR